MSLKARFTGRSALNLFGQCIGVGDSFDVWITMCGGRLLEQRSEQSPYRQELVDFNVPAIRVTPDALVVTLDFTVAVK